MISQLPGGVSAAGLFEAAGKPEKAAALYLKAGSWEDAHRLANISGSANLHLSLASTLEEEGQLEAAGQHFAAGKDFEAAVRLLLQQPGTQKQAIEIAYSSRHSAAAASVAQHLINEQSFQEAIEFLKMSGDIKQALALEKQLGIASASDVGESRTSTRSSDRSTATPPARPSNNGLSAGSARLLEDVQDLLETEAGPSQAAQKVVHQGDARVAEALLPHLQRMPELPAAEARQRICLVFHMHAAAAAAALDAARLEQQSGAYKAAHERLWAVRRFLHDQEEAVPKELEQALACIHSYLLVKRLVRRDDHQGAARMLIRVSADILHFPKHVVPILTSTVMECQRAGLQRSAFSHCQALMQPELLDSINPAYRHKAASLLRQNPSKLRDEVESEVACPMCGTSGPESDLDCQGCGNQIPFCALSGERMILLVWHAREWPGALLTVFGGHVSPFIISIYYFAGVII
ncbi:hypothetical protein WJX84_006318 [Apatococcus fuscideae]|uniref:IF140/IFT172/WDR19 TPR domain-containing protein n=1 Tax=Apatococcus fuscideae TaxID=2026836 RepID=A0AAW1SPW2_9CHLO